MVSFFIVFMFFKWVFLVLFVLFFGVIVVSEGVGCGEFGWLLGNVVMV